MRARTVFLLTLLLGTALAVLTPASALNPGPLVAGHATLAADCLGCHVPVQGTPAARCTACHAPDSIGRTREVRPAGWEPRPGLVGLHRSPGAADCLACHTDHAGADPAHATRPFAHDGLAAADRERCGSCHEASRPADATHERLTDECAACHTTEAWTPAQFDHQRFAGSRRCAACHDADRPDDGLHADAAANCADCHTTRAWSPADYAHERYFVLDRDHNARCATCHDQPGTYRTYTCYGCHEHTPRNILGEHREEGIRNLADCVRCHRSASEHEGRGDD